MTRFAGHTRIFMKRSRRSLPTCSNQVWSRVIMCWWSWKITAKIWSSTGHVSCWGSSIRPSISACRLPSLLTALVMQSQSLSFMRKKTAQQLKLPSNKRKARPGPMPLVQALARIPLRNCDSVEHPCKQWQLLPMMPLLLCSILREQRGVLKVCHVLISMKQVLLRLILFRISTRSLRVPLAWCRFIIRWACARCWWLPFWMENSFCCPPTINRGATSRRQP